MILLSLSVLLLVIGIFLFVYVKWNETYWERRGLFTYHEKDKTACITYRLLKEKGLKHGAYICVLRPCYMPIDLNIVKHILIKDANHFVHRGLYCNPRDDPLSGILPQLENHHEWKCQRSVITPIFSSGEEYIPNISMMSSCFSASPQWSLAITSGKISQSSDISLPRQFIPSVQPIIREN